MGVWDDIPGYGGTVPSVGGVSRVDSYIDRLYADDAAVDTQASSPYYYGQRGFFMDVASNLSRGVVAGTGLAASALDQVGIETELDEWAKDADSKYTFLKPDIDEAQGNDSWLYSGFKGALQAVPTTVIPIGVGALAGTVAGAGPVGTAVGIGAGMSTLVGLFGLGTYNQTYRENVDKIGEEAAKKLAFETAAWEVGSEAISDVVAVGTAGLFGAPAKALASGAAKTLKNALALGPVNFAKAVGASVSAEVGTEALNAYMQTSAQIKAGLDPGMSAADAALASIGPSLWLSGAMSVGLQGMQHNRKRILANELKNPDTPEEQRTKLAAVVHGELLKSRDPANPNFGQELAAGWLAVTEKAIKERKPLQINADFMREFERMEGEKTALQQAKDLKASASANINLILDTLTPHGPAARPSVMSDDLTPQLDTGALHQPGAMPVDAAVVPGYGGTDLKDVSKDPLLDLLRKGFNPKLQPIQPTAAAAPPVLGLTGNKLETATQDYAVSQTESPLPPAFAADLNIRNKAAGAVPIVGETGDKVVQGVRERFLYKNPQSFLLDSAFAWEPEMRSPTRDVLGPEEKPDGWEQDPVEVQTNKTRESLGYTEEQWQDLPNAARQAFTEIPQGDMERTEWYDLVKARALEIEQEEVVAATNPAEQKIYPTPEEEVATHQLTATQAESMAAFRGQTKNNKDKPVLPPVTISAEDLKALEDKGLIKKLRGKSGKYRVNPATLPTKAAAPAPEMMTPEEAAKLKFDYSAAELKSVEKVTMPYYKAADGTELEMSAHAALKLLRDEEKYYTDILKCMRGDK